MALNIPSCVTETMKEDDLSMCAYEDIQSNAGMDCISSPVSDRSFPLAQVNRSSSYSYHGNSSNLGSVGNNRSARSNNGRHYSGGSSFGLGSQTIYIFDMRGKFNVIVQGKTKNLDIPCNLIKQRVAKSEKTNEDQLLLQNVTNGNDLGSNTSTLIAIIDEGQRSDITLFINMGDFTFSCITVPAEATTDDLLRALSKRESYSLLCKGEKLDKGQPLDLEINLDNCRLVVLCKESQIVIRCLHRVSYLVKHIYCVPCLTTDTVSEFRQKLKLVMLRTTNNDDNLKEFIKSSHIKLTYRNEIFDHHERFDIGSFKNIDGTVEDYEMVVHLQPQTAIGVSLSYDSGSGFERVEKMFISRNISSRNLRREVAAFTHCSPNALKVTVNGKKLPETQTLSLFSELYDGCKLRAVVREAFSVYVKVADDLHMVSAYKLDTILNLKKNLGEILNIPCLQIKLMYDESELKDHQTLDSAHIRDQAELSAEIFKDRKVVHIRKRGSDSKFIVIDNFHEAQVKDLKVFYRRISIVDNSLDIEFRTQNSLNAISSDMYLSQTFDSDNDKYVLFTVERKAQPKTQPHYIFFAEDKGTIHRKKGFVYNSKIFLAVDNSSDAELPSNHDDDQNYSEHPPPSPCGIREAYGHESPGKQSLEEDREQWKSHSFLDWQASLSPHSNEYVPRSPIRYSKSCPDNFTQKSPISEQIVSDSKLDELVRNLPGDNWQPFMRDLLSHEDITKYANKDVPDHMFTCLKKWKEKAGNRATKQVLQAALAKNDLNLVSFRVFGSEEDVLLSDSKKEVDDKIVESRKDI